MSVGNYTYNPTKTERLQFTATTIIKYPNTGGYLLQNWVIKCKDKNINGEIQNFFYNQQKQTAQQVNVEQQAYLLSVIALCTHRHHLIITVILYLSAGKNWHYSNC